MATASPRTPAPTPEDPVLGLDEDPEGQRIVGEELRLLQVVHGALAAASSAAGGVALGRGEDEDRLLELREQVATAKPEDLPALFEQMHHLGALRAQRGKGAVVAVDRASPYFGHLRLDESGRRRDVLVGSKSYLDPGGGVRIVDWRHAPVSRIFYRYAEGEDYEELLGDRLVEGVVVARRSVAIQAGELVRVASPQGTFVRGEGGAWRRVAVLDAKLVTERRWSKGQGATPLGARVGTAEGPRLGVGADGAPRTDKHLPAIASLLDADQFDLIARPGAGLVAIQGSAGSGKTTVGLHRVAYLAFSEPGRFRPERMLVVVPNEALVHYVGRVLPSLEVPGVPVTTFARMARRLVVGTFPKLPTAQSDETPPVVGRAKTHGAMLRAIDALVAQRTEAATRRVGDAMGRWPQGEVVVAAWAATAGGATPGGAAKDVPLDARVSVLASWVAGKRPLPGVPSASSLPDVTRGALDQLGQALRESSRDVVGVFDDLVTDRGVLGQTFEGQVGFGPGQLDQVHAWCVRQSRVRSEGERDGEAPSLDPEDDALLLRIHQVLKGPLLDDGGKPLRYAHVFVDEVQDASPVALKILLDLAGPERCVTLAGDVAQRMLEDDDSRGEFRWEQLLEDVGAAATKLSPLKVSYRSTAEITSFARRVLGPYAHEAEPIASRHGPPVELFAFASAGEAVAFLADALKDLLRSEPYANVALVARFGPQADLYFEGLMRAEVPSLRRVRRQDFTWEPGIDVTDVRQTKGLEFDEVVLLETSAPSYPTTAAARHALYVGATRAAHQLWCVAGEQVSPVVQEALATAASG